MLQAGTSFDALSPNKGLVVIDLVLSPCNTDAKARWQGA